MTTHSILSCTRTIAFLVFPALAATACQKSTDKTDSVTTTATAAAPRTTINGPAGTIHIDDGGAGGIPVVFIHSFGGNVSHWQAQLAHLRTTRRAIALELRAHGESAVPANGDYSVKAFSQDIAAVVDSLALPKFVLVGHSLGGAAALIYTGDHPDRVAGLIVAGTPGATPADVSKPVIAALQSDQYQNTMDGYMKQLLANAKPEVASKVDAQFHRLSRAQSTTIVKETFAYDPKPALAAYNGPMLSVTTAAEKDTPMSLHNLKPGMQHQTIAGTSHWMHMDKPDEFNTIMDKFLQGIQP